MPSVCDAVSACNHFASLHKNNAVFFFNCRVLTARIPMWLVPFGRLEVNQQTVGCGQIGRILVVASGELVLEIGPKGAKTTTVGTLEEGIGGNRVFGALSVGVVGGARVVEGKVDVTLTLETIRDALDFLQNPNAITFMTSSRNHQEK